MATYTLPRPLALTAAPDAEGAEVVEIGDLRAAYILGGEGSQIPAELARRVGLLPQEPEAEAGTNGDQGEQPGPFARLISDSTPRRVGSPEGLAAGGQDSPDGTQPTVAEVLAHAETVNDPAEIQRLIDSEHAQEKPRKSLVEGLEKRKQSLTAPPENKAVTAPPENK